MYVGSRYQRGHEGIGSFLAGLFRRVLPLVKGGVKTLGKEAFQTGLNVMSDVAIHNTPIKESLHSRIKQSGVNLKRKAEEKFDKMMEGSGRNNVTFGPQLFTEDTSGQLHKRRKISEIKTKKRKNTVCRSKIKKAKNKKKLTKKKKVQAKLNKKFARDIFN